MTVEDFIEQDWPNQPSVKATCLTLLRGLRREAVLDHYTFGALHEIAENADDGLLAQAAMYLCTAKIGVLRTSLVYEVNGTFLSASNEEQESFAKGEPIVHPVSGVPIAHEDLFVVFVPGPHLREDGSA